MAEPAKTRTARRIWQLMFDFLMRTAPERGRSLGRRGLTPNDSRALASLHPEGGRTMRSLADEWECDASNATWIVDRLEKFGLAERRTVAHDRRVKLVVLTRRGMKMKAELMEEFLAPPGELLEMNQSDLEALQRALERIPSASSPAGRPKRRQARLKTRRADVKLRGAPPRAGGRRRESP